MYLPERLLFRVAWFILLTLFTDSLLCVSPWAVVILDVPQQAAGEEAQAATLSSSAPPFCVPCVSALFVLHTCVWLSFPSALVVWWSCGDMLLALVLLPIRFVNLHSFFGQRIDSARGDLRTQRLRQGRTPQ